MDYLEYRKMKKNSRETYDSESIEGIEDLINLIGIEGVIAVPFDKPLEGKYGHMIYIPNKNGEGPKSIYIGRKIHPEAKQVFISDKNHFEAIFKNALEENLRIEIYDKPAEMIMGLLIFKGEEVSWYYISFTNYKKGEAINE